MRIPLIALKSVNVDLSGRRVLHELNWMLAPGEHWAILGPNGAGKSTFLRLIRGDIWPSPIEGGERWYGFGGEQTQSPIGIRQKIALVSAEQQTRYMRTDWLMPVWKVVLTGLTDSDLIYHHPTPVQLAAVDAILAELGISDLRELEFQKLSQGQLRKALIARALVRKPPVLICDEIGVGLDRATRHALFDVIERAVDVGTQLLMTSHRQEELLAVIGNQLHLENGRASPSTRQIAVQAGSAPHLARDSGRAPERAAAVDDFVLDIQRATVAVEEGAKVILRDVTWRVNTGEHWMLSGDNGTGKSTLLKLIMGDVWPAHGGSIDRFGVRGFTDVWEIKRKIGYVSQELQARYHHDLTARQVVGTGFNASIGWLSALTDEQHAQVDAALAALDIAQLAERSLQQMSYGQARKVLVARALVNKPRLLILDEVFDGLDRQFRTDLAARFEQMAAQTTLLLVSHFDGDCLPCITHTLHIEDGGVYQR
jgi:molybdate transport system ATP-binding protein